MRFVDQHEPVQSGPARRRRKTKPFSIETSVRAACFDERRGDFFQTLQNRFAGDLRRVSVLNRRRRMRRSAKLFGNPQSVRRVNS
jgi:hypothetical protein